MLIIISRFLSTYINVLVLCILHQQISLALSKLGNTSLLLIIGEALEDV